MLVSTTLGVLAAGTGISLAATQGGSSSSVTCIVVADANAAADANSALSDVFPVGTQLHLTSAGRAVDVTVGGPITAAAATTAPPTGATSAPASASASAPASGRNGNRHRDRRRTRSTAPTPTSTAAAVANVPRVSVKAAANSGVDANSVCVKLSKNSFNTLGNVANGNNVGAFIATMTPVAAGNGAGGNDQAAGNGGNGQAAGNGGNGQAAGNGGGQAASSSPSAAASSAPPAAGNNRNQRHRRRG